MAQESKYPDLLLSLIENSKDVIYLLRFVPELKYEYINGAVERVTGFAVKEFYKDPQLHRRLIHPDDLRLLEELRVDPGRLKQPVLVRWFHRDGRMILTEENVTPIYDGDGAFVAIQGVGRFISYLSSAEDVEDPAPVLQRQRGTARDDRELVVICSVCKAARNRAGGWTILEKYLEDELSVRVSHGFCPACAYKLYSVTTTTDTDTDHE